ncbi:MAG: hypothetical protein ACUZ8H_11490 [Candidatus Anammoxibacter sp.]
MSEKPTFFKKHVTIITYSVVIVPVLLIFIGSLFMYYKDLPIEDKITKVFIDAQKHTAAQSVTLQGEAKLRSVLQDIEAELSSDKPMSLFTIERCNDEVNRILRNIKAQYGGGALLVEKINNLLANNPTGDKYYMSSKDKLLKTRNDTLARNSGVLSVSAAVNILAESIHAILKAPEVQAKEIKAQAKAQAKEAEALALMQELSADTDILKKFVSVVMRKYKTLLKNSRTETEYEGNMRKILVLKDHLKTLEKHRYDAAYHYSVKESEADKIMAHFVQSFKDR